MYYFKKLTAKDTKFYAKYAKFYIVMCPLRQFLSALWG